MLISIYLNVSNTKNLFLFTIASNLAPNESVLALFPFVVNKRLRDFLKIFAFFSKIFSLRNSQN